MDNTLWDAIVWSRIDLTVDIQWLMSETTWRAMRRGATNACPDVGSLCCGLASLILAVDSRWPADAQDKVKSGTMTISTYWTNVAKTGNPNGPGLPVWPVFSECDQRVMNLGDPIVAAGIAPADLRGLEQPYHAVSVSGQLEALG